MAKKDEVWICTICGYQYVGGNPPDDCPFCGVGEEHFLNCSGF